MYKENKAALGFYTILKINIVFPEFVSLFDRNVIFYLTKFEIILTIKKL
jgi:hypothetical protein